MKKTERKIDNNKLYVIDWKFYIDSDRWYCSQSVYWYWINPEVNTKTIAFEFDTFTKKQKIKIAKIMYKYWHDIKINDRLYIWTDWSLYFENDDFRKCIIH
jgi:hypothetical protein